MVETQEAEPKWLSSAEAVKLAKRKPDRGLERNDLLVRDKVLEPYWHWSREVGMSRDEAIDRAVNVFFEEVIVIGDQGKTEGDKGRKTEPETQTANTMMLPAASTAKVKAQASSRGPVIRALPFAEVFLATISIVLALFISYTKPELIVLLSANAALTAAAVAGRLFPRG